MKVFHVHLLTALVGASALVSVAYCQDEPPPPPPPAAPSEPPPPSEYQRPLQPMASISLPAGLSHSAVQGAIYAALQNRKWQIVSSGNHSVVAHLLHHHVDATVTLSFNRERVDFYSESYLVGHHPEDRIASFTREDWIRNLEHDIVEYASHGVSRE